MAPCALDIIRFPDLPQAKEDLIQAYFCQPFFGIVRQPDFNGPLRFLRTGNEGRTKRSIETKARSINYYERYQKIITAYNSEQDRATIEKTFMDLLALADSLNDEEQRYVREGFSNDEELSMYDMLFRDDLSKSDIQKLKKVAVDLLQKVKAKIAELDHWTDKQETKSTVDNLIRDVLWEELPDSYDDLSVAACRQQVFEYVFARYKEVS